MVFGNQLKNFVFKTTVLSILPYLLGIENYGPDQSFSLPRVVHNLRPAFSPARPLHLPLFSPARAPHHPLFSPFFISTEEAKT
jgi:hypothetical protein